MNRRGFLSLLAGIPALTLVPEEKPKQILLPDGSIPSYSFRDLSPDTGYYRVSKDGTKFESIFVMNGQNVL